MQALGREQALADEDGIEAFQVGQYHQLLQRGVVPLVTLGVGVDILPLFGGVAKKGYVQQVGLAGVDLAGLGFGDGGRDQGVFDGIGVDAVVDFGEGALQAPAQLEALVFRIFEALELDDQVQLEFG